jgi:sigma-E factor negative regulatory protein RseA
MNDQTKEHISSLMDGEISRETSRFLVRRLGSDDELCATWARYHLVRDCLRYREGRFGGEDLCSRISSALEDEPDKSVRKLPLSWLKPAAGMAIAASVALMAVVSVGQRQVEPNASPAGFADASQAEAFVTPQGLSPTSVTQQASLSGDSRMNAYLLRHYQAAGSAGGKGFVALVPIVTKRSVAEALDPDEQAESNSAQDEQQSQ